MTLTTFMYVLTGIVLNAVAQRIIVGAVLVSRS